VNEEKLIFELNTGIIPAAIYALKLRRSALAILKKEVPVKTIIRDIAELNKILYSKIVEELKIGKSDPIRITLKMEYDKSNDKLNFLDVKVLRYVEEEQLKKKYEEEIKNLSEQVARLDKMLDDQRKNYEAELNVLNRDLETLRKENEKLRALLSKVLEEIRILMS